MIRENSNLEIKKRKKISKLMIIFGSIFAVIFISLSVFALYLQNLMTSPNSDDTSIVKFVIESGEGGGEISSNLKEAGLIRNSLSFIIYLNIERLGDNLQAGEYIIAKNLSVPEVASIITTGNIVEEKLTFPEGWTIKKIAERLSANNISSSIDFINATKKDYDYEILKDKPVGVDLEGYLYPDTYFFSEEETAESVVKKMLENLDKKLTDDHISQAKAKGYNIHELLTLASIVEREVADPKDRKMVAGVFQNRLDIGMALESCATIQYITGENKSQFTYEETRIVDPYNTYINSGLPPGPVGSPSIEAIEAVLNPIKTSYLYFLSANGETYYSRTLDEHNQKKSLYLD